MNSTKNQMPNGELPPNGDLPKVVKHLFDFRKQGGAISVLSAFVGMTLLLLRLPADQVERLKEIWWIPSIVSVLVLIPWMFSAYIAEMKSRTKVEESIQRSLALLAKNFEHLNMRFDGVDDRLRNLYISLEKRRFYAPSEDTERFIQGES